MNKAAGIKSELAKLHEPGVSAIEKAHGIVRICKNIEAILEPIEAQIRANEAREAEMAPLRRYFVVGKADDDIRDHRELEAKLPPTRASMIRSALEDLGRDDAAKK